MTNVGRESRRVAEAVEHIREMVSDLRPEVGIVLGSGLGALADHLKLGAAAPYHEIPGFLPSTIPGHAGRLCFGHLRGVPVAVMQGRVHLYEGHPAQDVVLPVRVLVALGAKRLVITNAAGGCNPAFAAGDLMLITDHLNLTGRNPLTGPNEDALGPRFPDMSTAYPEEERKLAHEAAAELGMTTLREGVYAGLLGPSYETPAEVKMCRALGADAVGMSTVLEVIAARHMGARVLGVSCISNLAAGLSKTPLTHEEVKATADRVQDQVIGLVSGYVAKAAGAKAG